VAVIAVDVVRKDGYSDNASSGASKGRCVSGISSDHNRGQSVVVDEAEGCGDTCSSPEQRTTDLPIPVDWTTLTIIGQDDDDGFAQAVADEDKVYEAMGFEEVEPTPEEHKKCPSQPCQQRCRLIWRKQLLILMIQFMKNQCINGIGIIQK